MWSQRPELWVMFTRNWRGLAAGRVQGGELVVLGQGAWGARTKDTVPPTVMPGKVSLRATQSSLPPAACLLIGNTPVCLSSRADV